MRIRIELNVYNGHQLDAFGDNDEGKQIGEMIDDVIKNYIEDVSLMSGRYQGNLTDKDFPTTKTGPTVIIRWAHDDNEQM